MEKQDRERHPAFEESHTLERRRQIAAEYLDPKAKEARLARLEAMEDLILEQADQIVLAGLAFVEIAHDQAVPPPDWVEQFGQDGAEKRLAVAKSQWLPDSQSPAGMKLASRTRMGILKARERKHAATQNNLNVVISLPAPASADYLEPGQNVPSKEIE
jgi:hypothetical protein